MSVETKQCQNCKNKFTIAPEDFRFYEKIQVPPPTFCPECRLIRRLMMRNERSLYESECALCHKKIISIHDPASPYTVYCYTCWWSDTWDAETFGREYDFKKPFFAQLEELQKVVPRYSAWHINSENSQFANFTRNAKNAYLSYSSLYTENTFYSKNIEKSFDIFDSMDVVNSQLCYENSKGEKNYSSAYLYFSENCIDSWFLYNCSNCKNCFLCANLKNKEFHITNKSYSKKEYFEKIKEYATGSYSSLEKIKAEFQKLLLRSIHRYAKMIKCVNSTGNDLTNTKDAKECFSAYNLENVSFLFRGFDVKDSMDVGNLDKNELMYETISGGMEHSSMVKFSMHGTNSLNNVEYTDSCNSSSYLFGCVGMRDKKYCILNKQYAKTEYEKQVSRIKEDMSKMSYIDKKGNMYRYGEFFPPELSPFCYNETTAQEYFPLTKDQALEKGYKWKDREKRDIKVTMKTEKLPDHIKDIPDSIISEVIQCAHAKFTTSEVVNLDCNEQCTAAFRIILQELKFYRKMNLPLPRLCPNCRFTERIKQRNPLKLWHRTCMCDGAFSVKGLGYSFKNTAAHFHGDKPCPNKFETSYSPERKEIVYCEKCYLQEVA